MRYRTIVADDLSVENRGVGAHASRRWQVRHLPSRLLCVIWDPKRKRHMPAFPTREEAEEVRRRLAVGSDLEAQECVVRLLHAVERIAAIRSAVADEEAAA